jgi:hypothetical protein
MPALRSRDCRYIDRVMALRSAGIIYITVTYSGVKTLNSDVVYLIP